VNEAIHLAPTPDLGGRATTAAFGDAVVAELAANPRPLEAA